MMPRRVTFIGAGQAQVNWGSNDDPRDLLTVGTVYTVARIEIHTWHTKVSLVEFPGKQFNSVSFEAADEQS